MDKVYMCIDLKSFYASVECVERRLDPLTTNLVVADKSRTEKTICLAVSPSLKKLGIGGRARLFEVIQKVRKENQKRREKINFKPFKDKSYDSLELDNNPYLKLDYITAEPRMQHYISYSTKIYNIYLKYLAPDDIYVYSIDEVFCDITNYLKYYNMTAYELVMHIIKDILKTTGITATAGIGTNLYLAKIAMDIEAKHLKENADGVRIAYLDEKTYREKLWHHTPLTDFWRVGRGYMKKLVSHKMYTMGDIARVSLENEDLLYKLFGVNAELLIDHAWGYEPCTMADIKNYKPNFNSISSGQVLHTPYTYEMSKLIIREMIDSLILELVEKNFVTKQIVLNIGYDTSSVSDDIETTKDFYGRIVPKPLHLTINLPVFTSSNKEITGKVLNVYQNIDNKDLLVRRINITAVNVIKEEKIKDIKHYEQIDLFTDYEVEDQKRKINNLERIEEKNVEQILVGIKKKYGKNAIIKAMDLEEGATTIDRNKQIGGHKA